MFHTETLGHIVSESRKFGLALVMAHQNLAQLDDRLRQTLLGNVGSLISFRPGPEDVCALLPYFQPRFCREDLLRLPNHKACARLLVRGYPHEPFVLDTVVDEAPPRPEVGRAAREHTRWRYARPRSEVEQVIAARLAGKVENLRPLPPAEAASGATKILVVENDSVLLRMVVAFLRTARRGYEVLTATSGEEALQVARAEVPRLILLNQRLPDLEGTEVCQRLRENGGTAPISVMMVAAAQEHDARAMNAGADDYLSMPFEPEELEARIERLILADPRVVAPASG